MLKNAREQHDANLEGERCVNDFVSEQEEETEKEETGDTDGGTERAATAPAPTISAGSERPQGLALVAASRVARAETRFYVMFFPQHLLRDRPFKFTVRTGLPQQ